MSSVRNQKVLIVSNFIRNSYCNRQLSSKLCHRGWNRYIQTCQTCLYETPLQVQLPRRGSSRLMITREQSNVRIVCAALSKYRRFSAPENANTSGTELKMAFGNAHIQNNDTIMIENEIELRIYKHSHDVSADAFTKLPLKCRSCGAFMQTQDPDMKGFILPKKLPSLLNNSFEEVICSNCYSLRYSNKLLNVGIDRDNVLWQFSHMVDKSALILYVVDLMDISGSVLPEIMKLIGEKKRVIVVGNKLDMIASESDRPRRQELDIMNILQNFCLKKGLDKLVFKDVCLVSGITGYGIEKLVVLINKHREMDMNVYVVGSTNVGKSTIFNVLQNLSSISKDAKIPTQAIAHFVPGTTAGLLRHPIAFWRMNKVRRMFLEAPKKEEDGEEPRFEFIDDLVTEIKQRKSKGAQNTETGVNDSDVDVLVKDEFAEFVDLHALEKEKRWIYDTPALMNDNQITQFLTFRELKFLQQQRWMVPKTFIVRPGRSLLLGGLVRIDYCSVSRMSLDDHTQETEVLKGSQSVFLTVFCSNNIPLHPTSSERAESMLEKNYGNHLLKIPFDDLNRPGKFPALEPMDYEIVGVGWEKSAVDLCIAGLGWVAVTAGKGLILKVKLFTPKGIGQHVREECLMPYSVTKRGKRGVRYAGQLNKNIYECTRKGNPQLVKAFDRQNEITSAWLQKVNEKQKLQRLERKTERQNMLLAQGFKGKFRQLVEKVDLIEKAATSKRKELGTGEQ